MDMQALVSLVRRRWWVVVLALSVCVAVSGVLSESKPKVYRSTARLFVSVPGAIGVKEQAEGVQLTSQLLGSYARVVNSQLTSDLVSKAMQGRATPAQVRDGISATAVTGTVLIDVKAVDNDPVVAFQLANAAAASLVTVIDQLGANPTGGVKASIIDKAGLSGRPISPQPKRDIAVGAALGLALGAALAVALDALDHSLRDPEAISELFGVPLLSSIPLQRRLASDPLPALQTASPAGESYRSLRTAIRFRNGTHPVSTLLITSALAGDGKSSVAANLAITMAQDGSKVILIDADLRRSRLATMFNVPATPGLTDVLLGDSHLDDALKDFRRGLRILPIGSPGLNPSEALGSAAMIRVLEEAKAIADVVIIDAPPVLPVTDPAVLAAVVDGTIIVCRWGRTAADAAMATRATLENVGARMVGVVVNGEGGGRTASYYRHYSSAKTPRLGSRDKVNWDSSPVSSGTGSSDADVS